MDANGNLLSDGTYEYTYDAANRLVEVKAAGVIPANVISTYLYDGIDNRVGLVLVQRNVEYAD